jgi:aminopeptidase N
MNPPETELQETGVSKELALFRKSQVSDVNYQLKFHIPREKVKAIDSKLVITAQVHDLSRPLIMDFKEKKEALLHVLVNNTEIPIIHANEHLIISSNYLKKGKNKVEVHFIAGELSLNRNEDYLYTLLVPDRSRTLFPGFDQPDIKATYELTLTVPKNWKVLCASSVGSAIDQGDFIEYQFQKSPPMSSYLFSFVAGDFQEVEKDFGDDTMNILYRETDPNKIVASLQPITDIHQLSLNFLEEYTNVDFPYDKFDIAAIPGFQYGGMEHVGAVQYRESTLFLDSTATKSQELARAKLIAHETAHMWFGNLVTMKWFDDVWMKEVFANLMADKIMNPIFTSVDHNLQFLTTHYPSAYGTDRTKGTNPIKQKLNNLENAGSMYGRIIYNKAPIMMRQLEAAVGKENFRNGLEIYLNSFAHKNADWNDLVTILDKQSDLDIENWSQIWVKSSGRPVISGNTEYSDKNEIMSFEIEQRAEDGTDKIWPQMFDISLVYQDSIHTISVNLKGRNTKLENLLGYPKPLFIQYNSNGLGYGVFPIDENEISNSSLLKEDIAKAQSYLNCYENTLTGNITPTKALTYYKEALNTEINELILRMVSGEIRSLFWDFLSEEERQTFQPEFEKIVLNKLQQNFPSNIKKTLFGLYKSIAYSQSGMEQLYAIWQGKSPIKNLALNEDDLTSLALTLALYNHKNTEEILKEAESAITNKDRKARFKFLLPSLSHDASVSAEFFESFRDAKNREKESWVLAACYYIHHPLRQETAINHLETSLELLENIQQTGDIFFPKAWLDNTIGMYTSKKAYEILQNYINRKQDLEPNLMRKLLQSTDNLSRIHGEYGLKSLAD